MSNNNEKTFIQCDEYICYEYKTNEITNILPTLRKKITDYIHQNEDSNPPLIRKITDNDDKKNQLSSFAPPS